MYDGQKCGGWEQGSRGACIQGLYMQGLAPRFGSLNSSRDRRYRTARLIIYELEPLRGLLVEAVNSPQLRGN